MRVALPLLLLLGALGAGCGGAKETIREQEAAISALRAENRQLRATRGLLLDSLRFYDDIESGRYYRELRVLNDRAERMRYDITTLRDGGRTLAVLPADDLFEPGTATLSESGTERLAALAEQIGGAYPERPLRIEGHSDNVALGPELQERYPSNWELSAARAAAVARHLIEAHAMAPERFQLVAFGATQPIAAEDTPAGRRQNRRVRVAVLPEPRSYSRTGEAW